MSKIAGNCRRRNLNRQEERTKPSGNKSGIRGQKSKEIKKDKELENQKSWKR